MSITKPAGAIRILVSRPHRGMRDPLHCINFELDHELHDAWTTLERAREYSAFSAELYDGSGRFLSSRPVAFETIEEFTRSPIALILAFGAHDTSQSPPPQQAGDHQMRLQ